MTLKFRAVRRGEEAASHFLLGVNYLDREKWALAEREFRAALRAWPKYASARYCLGVIYWNQRKLDAAAAELRAALRLDPTLADAHFLLGRICFETFAFAKALKHFSAAAVLAPSAQIREYITLCKEVLKEAAARARKRLAKVKSER